MNSDSSANQSKIDDSPEKNFTDGWMKVLSKINIPKTDIYGYAVISIIEDCDELILDDGRNLYSSGVLGSIEDASIIVAILFRSISSDHIWWKSGYPRMIGDQGVINAARDLKEQLSSVKIVKKADW